MKCFDISNQQKMIIVWFFGVGPWHRLTGVSLGKPRPRDAPMEGARRFG